MSLKIGKRVISEKHPVYFIADIASNHDGSLEKAKELINLAKEAGADGAKFQHFLADKIVSDYGFKMLGSKLSHHSKWEKSVYEVYEDAAISREWTDELKKECDKVDIEFFTSPYDFEAIDQLDKYVSVYKIGSGDITWLEILEKFAKSQKPIILSTGASTLEDVIRAVDTILPINKQLAVLQCNTNYTGSLENMKYVSLNVIKLYKAIFPDLVIGLSDHTPKHAATLGAVTLGARIIEKHFTDDNKRVGPDHAFSMNPQSWKEMVERTRELEVAFGNFEKFVEENEKETVVMQRRCVRASRNLKSGEKVTREKLDVLRPAPQDSIKPFDIDKIIGLEIKRNVEKGEAITWDIFKK